MPINRGIKKILYIYTMKYYSALNNEIVPCAATWKGLEIITLCNIFQRKTKSYEESNLNNDTNELIYKIETDLQVWKTHGYQRGQVGLGIKQELGMNSHTATYKADIKQLSSN